MLYKLRAKLKYWDWDDVLAFERPKLVKIRDRKLGILSRGLTLGIFVYIIAYQVFWERGYMKKSAPLITADWSFRGPCCNANYNSSTISNPDGPPTSNSSICFETCPASYYQLTSQLPYCTNSTTPTLTKLNCEYFDPLTLLIGGGSEVSILTREQIKLYTVDPSCPAISTGAATANCLPQVPTTSFDNSFVADIESHTILLNHAVYAAVGDTFVSSTNLLMKGKAVDVSGNIVRRWNPNDGRAGDYFTVAEMLQWANISLEDEHPASPGSSKRQNGIVILLKLEVVPRVADTDSFKYQYSFEELVGQGFTDYSPLLFGQALPSGSVKRRGIHIVLVPVGEFGAFDFATLLVALTSGLTLLAVAETLTTFIATFFAEFNDLYEAAITDITCDFSDVKTTRDSEKEKAEGKILVTRDLMLDSVEKTLFLSNCSGYRQAYAKGREKANELNIDGQTGHRYPRLQYLEAPFEEYQADILRKATHHEQDIKSGKQLAGGDYVADVAAPSPAGAMRAENVTGHTFYPQGSNGTGMYDGAQPHQQTWGNQV